MANWVIEEVQFRKHTAGAYVARAPRSISSTHIASYDVLVSEVQGQNLVPSQINDMDLIRDATTNQALILRLPEVNTHVLDFHDGTEWKVCPWLICSGKRLTRDPGNKLLFRVDCDYTTGNRTGIQEADLNPISFPLNVASYPFIRETLWHEDSQIIYEEAKTGGQVEMRLPNGMLYSEPFRRKFPNRIIRQWQFESGIADINQTIEERLFTVQDRAFLGDPADPPKWMITGIDYWTVLIPIAGPVYASAHLMAYTIERSGKDQGWLDRRALISKLFRDANNGNKLTVARDDVDRSAVIDVLLNPDGTKKADQTGPMDFIDYVVQPEGIWSFFTGKGA